MRQRTHFCHNAKKHSKRPKCFKKFGNHLSLPSVKKSSQAEPLLSRLPHVLHSPEPMAGQGLAKGWPGAQAGGRGAAPHAAVGDSSLHHGKEFIRPC